MSSDLDYELACLLQAELNEDEDQNEHTRSRPSPQSRYSDDDDKNAHGGRSDKPLSIVDQRWEMLDPTPDVRAMFIEFDTTFFKGKLAGVEVKWSPRMTLCAGVCSYEGRGGLCSIRLSTPLLKLRPRKDLVETLLHEMIHAYLFVTQNNRDRDGHGPEFCKHMSRINEETGTKISIYHNFQDEVDLYRQHIWRCDGACRTRKPFFGYVKRAMNRAPSSRDTWWASHQQTCGGTYHKEKEPEGYGEKKGKRKREEENTKAAKKSKGRDVNSVPVFEGEGKTLNGTSNLNVHPTLQEIWSKKQHGPSTTNKSNTTSLNDVGPISRTSNVTSKSNGREGQDTIKNGTLKLQTNIHGFSGNVPAPTSGTSIYKSGSERKDTAQNGTSKMQTNIHGFSGNVPAPSSGTSIYKSGSERKDIAQNGTSKTKSNIFGFSGNLPAPTSSTYKMYKPGSVKEGSESRAGESDSDDSKENRFNKPNQPTHGMVDIFPGSGHVLGGKPKADTDRHEPKPDTEQHGPGWLSKNTQDPLGKVNKEKSKNGKHIRMSRKIVKLMEIVGSDSDSDTDEKTPENNATQSDLKAPAVQYISDSDEDEEEYNTRITSQMFAKNQQESKEAVSVMPKTNYTSGEGHTSSYDPSARFPNKNKPFIKDDKWPFSHEDTFNSLKTDRKPDETSSAIIKVDSKMVSSTVPVGPTVKCPICGNSVLESAINKHLDQCLNHRFLNQ